MRLGVANYGVGTWAAVVNMSETLGIDAMACHSPDALDEFSHLIIPGVGNYGRATGLINSGGWRDAITSFAVSGKPTLGICLGMQLLGLGSDEAEGEGLGLISFRTEKMSNEGDLRTPHMGWNSVEPVSDHPIFDCWDRDFRFYFVHSYAVPENATESIGLTRHNQKFSSMVAKDNILGVQFHPEKSRRFGMKLLENFSRM